MQPTSSPNILQLAIKDDSVQSRTIVGAGEHVQSQDGKPTASVLNEVWRKANDVLVLNVEGADVSQNQQWQVFIEETSRYPKHFRAAVQRVTPHAAVYSLYFSSEKQFLADPDVELHKLLPESVFGALVGAAYGAHQGNLAQQKLFQQELKSNPAPTSTGAWKAPVHAFTLHTAYSSPMAERWSFAVQMTNDNATSTRLLLEQLRNGKEWQIGPYDPNEGLGEFGLEALPSAVHMAALSLLVTPCVIGSIFERDIEAGEIADAVVGQRNLASRAPRMSMEQRNALERELEECVGIVKDKQARHDEKS